MSRTSKLAKEADHLVLSTSSLSGIVASFPIPLLTFLIKEKDMFKFQYNLEVQVVAEQLNDAGLYIHVDTEYFTESGKLRDWLTGAVEWADRFRIYKVGSSDIFFEGVVVNNTVPKWEKLNLNNRKIISVYA
jgi:hypothetical protein